VLVYKNVIETARLGRAIWITLLALACVCVIHYHDNVAILGTSRVHELSKIIAVFLYSNCICQLERNIWFKTVQPQCCKNPRLGCTSPLTRTGYLLELAVSSRRLCSTIRGARVVVWRTNNRCVSPVCVRVRCVMQQICFCSRSNSR